MKKKRNYVSPLWQGLIPVEPGDDVVYGDGSAQGGIDWASIACTAWNGDDANWGEISDSAGTLWAYGPYDPETPGKAWQLAKEMQYSWDGETVSVPANTWVDFDTLSACLDWTGECGDDMGGGGF